MIGGITNIKRFLDGHNQDVRYLVNVSANRKNNTATCFFQPPNGEKYVEKIKYKPFLYVKDLELHGIELYSGEKKKIESHKREKHGIEIEKLRTDKQERLVNGFCYRVSSYKSFQAIIDYFIEGGLNPYEREVDEEGKEVLVDGSPVYLYKNELFYIIKPVEQFFISTGIRLYKGYDDYDKIHRLVFDIETTGLRYESSQIFLIGIKDNFGFEKIIEVPKFDSSEDETKVIGEFLETINELNPSIISGYNSEDFDFPYILGRCKKIDVSDEFIKEKLGGKNIIRTFGYLKYGQTTEKYDATKIYGTSVIDIRHAAKKTAAVNNNIRNTKLKYICKFENIAKENRVYIDGDKIFSFYQKNKIYLTNKTFNYDVIPDEFQDVSKKLYRIQENQKKNKITKEDAVFLRKEVLEDVPDFSLWYKNKRKERNDETLYLISGKKLVHRYLQDDLWETQQVDELYNQTSFMFAKMVPTTFDRVSTMGTATIWELLLVAWSYENDLAIPDTQKGDRFSGGLTRCFKTGFSEKIIKIDYGSLYPMIQLTHDVFPFFDITGVQKKMLIYLTLTRNIYKKISRKHELKEYELDLLKKIDSDFYFKYNNNTISKKDRAKSKVKELPIKIINNSLYGALGAYNSFNWSDGRCASRIAGIGRIRLRHAIKWFSDFGCVPLLAVTDGINFKIPDKINILVDDNEVNVVDYYGDVEKMWFYGGKSGVHALINKFNKEEMSGPFMSIDDDGFAHSAYNLSRINYITLYKEVNPDTNEVVNKLDLTGNTVKSNTMPEYIEDFLNKGLLLLLNGKGVEFVDYYHDYVDDIFYKRIPIKKIASKSRVKRSIKSYLNRGNDINGRPKASQAHMELIIQERKKISRDLFIKKGKELIIKELNSVNKDFSDFKYIGFSFDDIIKYINEDEDFHSKITEKNELSLDRFIYKVVSDYMPPEPELDTTIYYVNTGYRKSHLDVDFIVDKDTKKKRIASKLISEDEIKNNPNMLGYYNTNKYLDAFNSRVEKFLVGFDEVVREKILVKVERKKVKNDLGVEVEQERLIKNYFTDEELKLKNFDADLLDDTLFLEKGELKMWNKYGYNPYEIWDGIKVEEGGLIYNDYLETLEYVNKKLKDCTVKKVDEKLTEGDLVLIKSGDVYHIGKYDGLTIKIIKHKIKVPQTKRVIEDKTKNNNIIDKLGV